MNQRNRPSDTQAQGGFALLIALTLMAFVLVLLVTITLLVNVETASSQTTLNQLRAKESARLALMMALGDLQRYAGPDQRVTARAEVLGSGLASSNPFWTGVWETSTTTATPHWMVSWQDQDSSANLNSLEMMQLIGSDNQDFSASQYVQAPIINIDSSSNTSGVEIAWWISDEGVKASAGLIDSSDNLDDAFLTSYATNGLSAEQQKQALKQITARKYRIENILGQDISFSPGEVEDITDSSVAAKIETTNEELQRSVMFNQLALLDGISTTKLKENYHDLTFLSQGILSNTKSGGLKRDLSDQTFDEDIIGLKINNATREFLWNSLPDSNADIPLTGIATTVADALSDGDSVNTTPPIITEFALYFAISAEGSSTSEQSTARAFLRFEAEVWSPYGFRHQFAGASSTDSPEIFVKIEGLPDLELSFYDKDTDTYTSNTTLSFNQISPEFELDLTNTHKSGEIRKTAGNWPINASSSKDSFYYTNDWDWTVIDPSYNEDHRKKSFPDGDSINYKSADSTITLILKNESGEILQKIENIPYGAIEADFGFYVDSATNLGVTDAPIVFYYRMLDDRDELESWLTEVDPRSIYLDVSKPEVFDLLDINDVNGDNQGDADIPVSEKFSYSDFFYGNQNNSFFRLFDVPSTIPYSLGILQHLQIVGERPFAIGNQWGGSLNGVFDNYFISGIPQDAAATFWNPQLDSAEHPLPNPHLSVYAPDSVSMSDIIGNESSKHLLVNGSFNINSTSSKAWYSLLSANFIYDWDYTVNKGTSSEENSTRMNLENAFFRLPFSGHYRSEAYSTWPFPFEDYEDELTIGDDYPALSDIESELVFRNSSGYNTTQDWRPSLSLGLREISSSNLEILAEKIVEKLSSYGTAFPSLEDFINSGLLDDAIAETSINTIVSDQAYVDADDDARIPLNAPTYLSQADIITAIAPRASARSDTFKILAKAKIKNPTTGDLDTEATCIALVQRFPEQAANNTSGIMSNAEAFGRKFVILEIQWLDQL